jgi:phosphoribosylanthranilate isomerase
MSLFVKICGLRNAADVKAAVAAGADAVGFVFAESVRRVSPAEARDATRYLPKRVKRVAVMRHPENSEWQEVLQVFAPDVLQTDSADFDDLDVPANVESGQGQTVDWQRAAEIAKRGKMILAGGLGIDNIATAIRTVCPYGVDVSSAVESRPGVKDAQLIKLFVSAARAVEKDA